MGIELKGAVGPATAQRPEAMQLRYLGTLDFIGGDKSSTIVFPFPMEFGSLVKGRTGARPTA